MANVSLILTETLTEKFWDAANECYDKWHDDESMEEVAREILGNLADSGDVADFSTDCASVFDSPGLTAGFVSACWIDKNGKLGHVCYSWTEW